jgi:hypothetical protein
VHQLSAQCRNQRSRMVIYIYGIIDSNNPIDQSIRGLEGAAAYNIPFRDIGVVASNLNEPTRNTSGASALAHEALIERLMEDFTVLPVKFLTVFKSSQDVLSMIGTYYGDFRDNLDRLRNKVEFGIKVIWPAARIKAHIIDTFRKTDGKALAIDNSPQKRFMTQRFKSYKVNKAFKEEAGNYINAMDVLLSKFVTERKLETLKTEKLLLSAVYLVEKDKQNDFKEAFEHVKTANTSFRYLFSGPWPPYNFVILSNTLANSKIFGQADMFDAVKEQPSLVQAHRT